MGGGDREMMRKDKESKEGEVFRRSEDEEKNESEDEYEWMIRIHVPMIDVCQLFAEEDEERVKRWHKPLLYDIIRVRAEG